MTPITAVAGPMSADRAPPIPPPPNASWIAAITSPMGFAAAFAASAIAGSADEMPPATLVTASAVPSAAMPPAMALSCPGSMPLMASLTRVMPPAMPSAAGTNVEVMPLMAPAMFSTPMDSMMTCIALAMRFWTLSIAVPIPCVASLAWSLNDANAPVPFWSRSMTAWLKSPIETEPFCRAWYRSLLFFVGPSKAWATWLSCPGMTSCSVRQSWSWGLPLARIWLYCCIARLTSAVDAPAARHMSLNAMPRLVAWSSPPASGASCWTMDVSAGSDVGMPSMALLMRLIDSFASPAEYPRFCMTFGKFLIVSARMIALPIDAAMASNPLLARFCATPMIAPILPLKPAVHFEPAPAPDLLNGAPSCWLMDAVRLSNFGVSRTVPRATSAIHSPS